MLWCLLSKAYFTTQRLVADGLKDHATDAAKSIDADLGRHLKEEKVSGSL